MVARTTPWAFGVIFLGIALLSTLSRADAPTPPTQDTFAAGDYTLTGPFVHDNLTLYLIHGSDHLKARRYVTLQQAIRDRIVIVYETHSVNDLQIENLSRDVDCYIESGDILEGGHQDRTVASDFICPARSGKMRINVFCVENGRWHGRSGENSTAFSGSRNCVAGKNMKILIHRGAAGPDAVGANQGAVWGEVYADQLKLSKNVGREVTDPSSPTSFHLALENRVVKQTAEACASAVGKLIAARSEIAQQSDVIGYVTVINGKVSTADVYGSHDLFVTLWPRLLKSAAVEAFAERDASATFTPVTVFAVKGVIEDADAAEPSDHDVNARVQVVARDSGMNLMFETHDRADPAGGWIHRCYLAKDQAAWTGPATQPVIPPEQVEIRAVLPRPR